MLIDWLKGRVNASRLLADLEAAAEPLGINAISVAEVFSGAPPDAAVIANEHLSKLEYWAMDYGVSRMAGLLRYKYLREGRPLSAPDTLMAAHAISLDATLVTGNVRDFPMPELKVLRLDH